MSVVRSATRNVAIAAVLLAGPARAQTPADAGATITVQNNRSVPVTVFAEQEIGDLRLGVVPARETAQLDIPLWLAEERPTVYLFVHPEGELDLESRAVDVRPGVKLALLIPEKGVPEYPPEMRPRMTAELTPAEEAETTVTVDNRRTRDVVVYVERGDLDLRLGTVPAGSKTTLPIPDTIARDGGSISLFAHVVHGVDLASELFEIRPGAHLGLTISQR